MRKLFLILMMVLPLLIFNSCNEEVKLNNNQIEEITEVFTINNNNGFYKSSTNLEVTFTAELNPESQIITSYDVSDNLLEFLDLNKEEFDAFIENEVGDSFFNFVNSGNIDLTEMSDPNTFSGCMADCDTNYRDDEGNKEPGYGRCRFRCWVDAVEIIIKDITPI